MNVRWLIINIIWTIVYLVACFSAGWIIRPRFDEWKKKRKEKKTCKINTNIMEVPKDEKVV